MTEHVTIQAKTSTDSLFTILCEAIEAAGYRPREYSGRAMYTRKCLGFTTNRPMYAVSLMTQLLCEDYEERIGTLVNEPYTVFDHAQQDSMGRDTIIYFPSVKWEGRDEQIDEDNEDDDE